uniref:Uncharacterized protein n=1 Tax=Vespula pensylvanica TaxID=30213 RepID=A0A834JKG8_VESPE|nr:hypothetical protein H0235_018179 [Vespula pensylvanica]
MDTWQMENGIKDSRNFMTSYRVFVKIQILESTTAGGVRDGNEMLGCDSEELFPGDSWRGDEILHVNKKEREREREDSKSCSVVLVKLMIVMVVVRALAGVLETHVSCHPLYSRAYNPTEVSPGMPYPSKDRADL